MERNNLQKKRPQKRYQKTNQTNHMEDDDEQDGNIGFAKLQTFLPFQVVVLVRYFVTDKCATTIKLTI